MPENKGYRDLQPLIGRVAIPQKDSFRTGEATHNPSWEFLGDWWTLRGVLKPCKDGPPRALLEPCQAQNGVVSLPSFCCEAKIFLFSIILFYFLSLLLFYESPTSQSLNRLSSSTEKYFANMRNQSWRGMAAALLGLFVAGTDAQTGTLSDLGTLLSGQKNLTSFYSYLTVCYAIIEGHAALRSDMRADLSYARNTQQFSSNCLLTMVSLYVSLLPIHARISLLH